MGRLTASISVDPAFAALKSLVIARTGHHYYDDKDVQLGDHVAVRMRATGDTDLPAYAERLARADDPEWAALESAITINETFFFRFAEQFEAIRRHLLPERIAAHRADRRLRLWSVGCSTGAEAHSLAILLREALGDALDGWQVQLVGTDIDEAAIVQARNATYGGWALRTLSEPERLRYFERRDDRYRLKDGYRGIARFERHNMMALLDPANALQFTGFDLILCRNVLIYFSHAQAAQMVQALTERLAPGGTLLLGHAELNPGFDAFARPVEVGGILAYRRLDEAVAAAAEPFAAPAVAAPAPVPPRRSPTRPRSRQPEPPSPAIPHAPAQSDDLRASLSQGDPDDALLQAEARVAAHPRDPVAHYLAALGALALGRSERAEKGFRSALYLDTGFAMAHYLLGRHLLAEGRVAEGTRALRNALHVAAVLSPDAELAEGDGITAGALVAAARAGLAGA